MSAYNDAVLAVLGQATESIRVFDVELGGGPLASARASELIGSALHLHARTELTIVLHRTQQLASACPRLLQLYQRRGHQIRVLESAQRHHEFMQPFIVVDRKHLVTRFHADHPRGKLCLDESAELAPFLLQFDELLEAATPASGLAALNL